MLESKDVEVDLKNDDDDRVEKGRQTMSRAAALVCRVPVRGQSIAPPGPNIAEVAVHRRKYSNI